MWNNQFVVLLCAILALVNSQVQFRVIRQWRYFNYTWPSSEALENATYSGSYIPENIVAAGVMHYKDWYYLTMPRMKNGVAATLGRITALPGNSTAPLVSPYPSWEFNKLGNCTALQNVQNIEVDLQGKMWIVDGGHTGSLTPVPSRTCPPKLIIFDIEKDVVEKTFVFPEEVVGKNSFLYDIVLDDGFAYITDNSGKDPGIVVFSLKESRAWKIRHTPSMRGDITSGEFQVNQVPLSNPISIAGIALAPKKADDERLVYYCPLSSVHLYAVSNLVLRNESNANNGMDYSGAVKDVGFKYSQTDGMIMSNEGRLYYGLLPNNTIIRWDTQTAFSEKANQKVLTRDPEYIQWTNSFTFDGNGSIVVLTDTLQKFIYGSLNIKQRNFWLLSAHTGEKSYQNPYEKPQEDASSQPATSKPNTNSAGDSNISRFIKPATHKPSSTEPPKVENEIKNTGKSSSSRIQRIDVLSVIILNIVICNYFYNKY